MLGAKIADENEQLKRDNFLISDIIIGGPDLGDLEVIGQPVLRVRDKSGKVFDVAAKEDGDTWHFRKIELPVW